MTWACPRCFRDEIFNTSPASTDLDGPVACGHCSWEGDDTELVWLGEGDPPDRSELS